MRDKNNIEVKSGDTIKWGTDKNYMVFRYFEDEKNGYGFRGKLDSNSIEILPKSWLKKYNKKSGSNL